MEWRTSYGRARPRQRLRSGRDRVRCPRKRCPARLPAVGAPRNGVSGVTGPTVAVGDVLYLHERVTRLSGKDRMRWCIVTAVIGRNVRVAGRSTTRKDGVPVPETAMDQFDKDGWVPRPSVRISLADALDARNIGPLPDHYLQQVLFYCNEEMP